MEVGSIVTYKRRPEEDPVPGVVLKDWGNGYVQLYMLHFEGRYLEHAVPVYGPQYYQEDPDTRQQLRDDANELIPLPREQFIHVVVQANGNGDHSPNSEQASGLAKAVLGMALKYDEMAKRLGHLEAQVAELTDAVTTKRRP